MKKDNIENEIYGNPEILLAGSIIYSSLEKIGFVLHLIALMLGISAIVWTSIEDLEILNIALETATLVVIILIIINHILRPIIKKALIRRFLNDFWSVNKIVNTFYVPIKNPNSNKIVNNKEFLDIKFRKIVTNEVVEVGFRKISFFEWRLAINYHASNFVDGIFEWKIDHIFIDIKRRIMEIEVFLPKDFFNKMKEVENNVLLPSESFVYTIDLQNKRASWIGKNHNNLPTWLGEWSIENNNK